MDKYADYREEYKDRVEYVEHELNAHKAQLATISQTVESLDENQ